MSSLGTRSTDPPTDPPADPGGGLPAVPGGDLPAVPGGDLAVRGGDLPAVPGGERPPGRPAVRPAERYGDGVRWRRRVRWGTTGVLAVALTAWACWSGLSQAHAPTADTEAYSVLSDSEVQVVFSVTKRASATASCQVEALSSGSAQVGLAVVRVGPGPHASTQHRVTIRTQQRAVTGDVVGCTTA